MIARSPSNKTPCPRKKWIADGMSITFVMDRVFITCWLVEIYNLDIAFCDIKIAKCSAITYKFA